MEQTLNFNAAECIKSVSNFGATTYVNICNGNTKVVPWGTVDWVLAISVCGIGALIAAIILGLFAMMILDW